MTYNELQNTAIDIAYNLTKKGIIYTPIPFIFYNRVSYYETIHSIEDYFKKILVLNPDENSIEVELMCGAKVILINADN